jgi:hypothetical protein
VEEKNQRESRGYIKSRELFGIGQVRFPDLRSKRGKLSKKIIFFSGLGGLDVSI